MIDGLSIPTDLLVLVAGILGLALVAYVAMRVWVLRLVHAFVRRTKGEWDDKVMEHNVFQLLAWFPVVLILYRGAEYLPSYQAVIQRALGAWLFVLVMLLVSRVLDALNAIYETYPVSHRRPMKSYLQMFKLFLFLIGGIVAVCLLLNTSPWGVLSGLGALTAVLMLVFKDTILSLVASVQLTANDLVRKGDWIEMPSAGVDGDVEDIALHTVKIRNFDKTIVALPTSRLISDSFRNWRGMSEAGARRMKRAVYIDQSSIKFVPDEELGRFEALELLVPYLRARREEIAAYNQEHDYDRTKSPVNGRGMTNLGLFRAYVRAYLLGHPKVRNDLTLLVRHLNPDAAKGLPLEIYCFADTTEWAAYEDIQADILDHVLAAMPEFGLRAYQRNALTDGRV
ncbi:mechanosensitive ion channel family protein [Desulfovibrio ferrophilus]|uniref:MscS Mechanosensitive ion channel n=1 Tax=Desulfovibrio ferrophilus TaxID=241368 RepID=A0A2Z6AZM1_9BACT|nr:mechanosensitive ion channel family protein [Desulfovibrio ferrophilus]BBD08668.1 MscS Mechanosensitive ion channel [Desulfovibrio ferrophilus]